GTSESRIPAMELLTFCCASGKRNIGMKFPIHPPIITQNINFFGMCLMFLIPKKASASPAMVSLSAPTCMGENTAMLCLIKIKELPQVNDKIVSKTHLLDNKFMEQM